MAIACVYCGGEHERVDEVRACWQRAEGVEGAAAPAAPAVAPVASAATPPVELPVRAPAATTGTATGRARRGPPALGRHVIVAPGADAPPEWGDARVLRLDGADLDDPADALRALRDAAIDRRGLVVEIDRDVLDRLADGAAAETERPAHDLGPRFAFDLEALHHLLSANAVVDGGWWLLDRAVELGASPVTDGGPGDVTLPDGGRAWLDGGPTRFTGPIDDCPVLLRVSVEHGALRPLGATNTSTADLAPDQLAAVTHDGATARIIAPAGSGKTRVLTERARHLLHHWQLPGGAVCLVAFNKRAQEEMRARTSDLRGLQVRTLNAIALAVVNGTKPFAPQPAMLRTVDEGEVRRLIGNLVSFPRKRNADPVAPWIEALSLARLGLREPSEVEALYDGDVDGFTDVLPRYRAALARQGALDFDEQIARAIELLLGDAGVRRAAQRACRLLLVDEFQDLTPAHLLLIRLLAGPDGAVFAVGDDDQTIYGYNGADPGWLIDFGDIFPGAGDHPLEVNYRCPGGVVRAADTLLRHNRRRVPKTIRAASTDPGGWTAPDGDDPVEATLATVTTALADGRLPTDVAVLTRVNSLLAPVQLALVAAGIPTNGGVGAEFAERTSVRAALAWLRLATAGGRNLPAADIGEALRRPARPLHPNVVKWVGEQSSLDGLRRLAGRLTSERESERVAAFADDIEALRRLADGGANTARLLDRLRDTMGLAATVVTLDANRRGMNRASQSDDLTALAELARLQPEPARFEGWLREALRRPWAPDGVTLATVHRVKGQEWPIVVVHHADADQFPHRLAEDVEEERRLFHVAITRTSAAVTIVAGDRPSPFIAELTAEPGTTAEVRAERPVLKLVPPLAAARPGEQLAGSDAALFEELRAAAQAPRRRQAGVHGGVRRHPGRHRRPAAHHARRAVAHQGHRAVEARSVRHRPDRHRRGGHHHRLSHAGRSGPPPGGRRVARARLRGEPRRARRGLTYLSAEAWRGRSANGGRSRRARPRRSRPPGGRPSAVPSPPRQHRSARSRRWSAPGRRSGR